MLLEKRKNKRWTFVDSFAYSYCFSHSVFCNVKEKDLDKDGIQDFIIEYGKWSTISLVYKYDRAEKSLSRVGFFSENPQKIMGYKNLFYDIWYDKWNEWSYIYTIRNNQRINLGIAELKVKQKLENEIYVADPQYISIRQFTDDGKREINKISKQHLKKFSYKRYWTENARLFFNSKNKHLISDTENYFERFEIMD